MAGLCSDSVLTGQDGLIQFKPAGTSVCIADYTPFFPEGTTGTNDCIVLPCGADFRVGDCITFTEEDGANLPDNIIGSTRAGVLSAASLGTMVAGSGYQNGTYSNIPLLGGSGYGAAATLVVFNGNIVSATIASGGENYELGDQLTIDSSVIGGGEGFSLTIDFVAARAATAYYVVAVDQTDEGLPCIKVSLTEDGAPITFDGTTGGVADGAGEREDSPSPAHVNITLCDYITTCNVRSFSVDFSRDELDVTTLPCGTSGGCDTLAQFRKTQAGYASASGTLEVYFTCDQTTMSNRLLGSSLLKTQTGAAVKLYVCTDFDGDGNAIDENSLYIEAEISLLGLSFSVNPDDVTTATINFGITRMIEAFGTKA